MILVNIDGPDAVGKSTIIEEIKTLLFDVCGYKVESVHFPRYETPIGKVIKRSLNGEILMSPESLQMLYGADRVNFCEYAFNQFEKEVDLLLVDRYATSGLVYGQVDGLTKEKVCMIQEGVIAPDLNIILTAPFDVLIKRMKDRGNVDKYENEKMLEKSIILYNQIHKLITPTIYVDANRDVDKISNEIMYYIKLIKAGDTHGRIINRISNFKFSNRSD